MDKNLLNMFIEIFPFNKDLDKKLWEENDLEEYNSIKEEMDLKCKKIEDEKKYELDYDSNYHKFLQIKKENQKPYIEKLKVIMNKRRILDGETILSLIKKFDDKYDLDDVRIFLIVREFLTNYLITNKMTNEILTKGVMVDILIKDETFTVPNKLLQYKHNFSKLYLDTIEKLDKITKEDKIIEIGESNNFFDDFMKGIPNKKVKTIKYEDKDLTIK